MGKRVVPGPEHGLREVALCRGLCASLVSDGVGALASTRLSLTSGRWSTVDQDKRVITQTRRPLSNTLYDTSVIVPCNCRRVEQSQQYAPQGLLLSDMKRVQYECNARRLFDALLRWTIVGLNWSR
ncbi:hypothetical protein GCM10010464_80030 [Pseudonocardia yunnanensis]